MDQFATSFEIVVLSTTAFSVFALVGLIVWDSIVDARLKLSSSHPAQAKLNALHYNRDAASHPALPRFRPAAGAQTA